jgi:hypothetical protein
LADPAVQSRLTEFGYEAFPSERQTTEALAALQRADADNGRRSSKSLPQGGMTANGGEAGLGSMPPANWLRHDRAFPWKLPPLILLLNSLEWGTALPLCHRAMIALRQARSIP